MLGADTDRRFRANSEQMEAKYLAKSREHLRDPMEKSSVKTGRLTPLDPQIPKKAAKKKGEKSKKLVVDDFPRINNNENFIETNRAVYEITSEIGSGSFGAVYGVTRRGDGKQFALKCESVHVRKSMLQHEAGILQNLSLLNSPHFLELVDHGSIADRFLFIVMKLVGANLWDVRQKLPERRFKLPTALRIAEQTLAGLRDLHRVGILHRDIKPPNFAIGREEDDTFHTVYVFDFGLSRKIAYKGVDLRTPRKMCAFRGTPRYASVVAHELGEQSRKDDLEAWWYMVAEMIIFELPWKHFRGNQREAVRCEKMKLRHVNGHLQSLFRVCGDQMCAIFLYLTTKLEYSSIPDYDFVFRHVQNAALANMIAPSTPMDWDEKNEYHGPLYKMGEKYICKELE